jgi:hypothetical protein
MFHQPAARLHQPLLQAGQRPVVDPLRHHQPPPRGEDTKRNLKHVKDSIQGSVILRKLAAYPRQNSLALALRELGKLERTFFTLQWLQDPGAASS